MGLSLIIYRASLDVAVDILTQRRRVNDFDDHPELWGKEHYPLRGPLPETAPRVLDLQKSFRYTLEVMTETLHDHFSVPDRFAQEETDDPREWSIFGARLVGWEAPDFPLRYSLPAEVEAICRMLDEMTEARLREQARTVLRESPHTSGTFAQHLHEELVPNLLPSLRQFYEAARAAEHLVIHWLH